MKHFNHFLLFFICSITISRGQNCTINAGVNNSVCLGQPILLDGSLGGAANPSSLRWTIQSQPNGANVILNAANSLLTTVSNVSVSGTYTFALHAVCGDGVPIRDEVSVTVNPVPVTPTFTGVVNYPCYKGGPVNVSGSAPGPGETATWSVESGTGSFSSPSSASTSFTPTFPTEECATSSIVTVRYTIRTPSGCQTSVIKNITFSRFYPVYAAANPTQVCGTKTTLSGSCPGSGTAVWSQVSGPNTATIQNANSISANVSGLIAGNYVFRYTVSGSCSSGSEDVNVTVAGTSAVTQANIGPDQYHCQLPDLISLTGNKAAVGETATWSQLSGGTIATIANPTQFNTTASGLTNSGAPYKFIYTISNGICYTTDTVTVYKRPELTLTEGDKEMCVGIIGGFVAPIATSTFGYNELDTAIVNITFLSGPKDALVGATVRNVYKNGASPTTSNQNITVGKTASWSLSRSSLYSRNSLQDSQHALDLILRINYYVGVYKFRVSITTPCGTVEKEVMVTRGLVGAGVNAGTDVALPCDETGLTLAGNLADDRGLWSAVQLPTGASNPINSTNQTLRNPPISDLIPGTYVFRYTNNMGPSCTANQFDEVKVVVANNPPPTPNAGADLTGCAGSMTLNGSPVPPDAFGNWTVVSPASSGVTFSDPSAANPTVYNLQPNTSYTLRYTLSNGCGSSFDEVTINTNASVAPDKPTIKGRTFSQCGILSRALPGDVSLVVDHPALATGTTASWTVITDPVGITYTTKPLATNTTLVLKNVTQSTVFSFIYTISNPSCPSSVVSDTLTGYIRKATDEATLDAGLSQQFCSVESYPVTVNLAGSVSTGPVFWRQLYSSNGQQATITTPNEVSSPVTIPADGEYRFQYEILSSSDPTCEGRFGQDVVQVTTASPGDIALAGDDIQFCNSTGATVLNAQAVTNGRWEIYQVLNGNTPVIENLNSPTSSITFSGSGSTVLKWNSYGSNMECGPSSSDLLTVSYTAPANAGNDLTLCGVTSINLSAANPAPAVGTWSQVSGPAANIQNPSSPQTIVYGLVEGSYVFRFSVDNGGGCTSTDDVSVMVSENSDTAYAGADSTACSGGTSMMQLHASPPQTGYTGTWSVFSRPTETALGKFSDIHDPRAIYEGLTQPGQYIFAWTISDGVCSSTDYVEFTSNSEPCSLPVTLIRFSGKEENGLTTLQWATSAEFNFSHFEVEYSSNGKAFNKIGRVSPKSNSEQDYSYSYEQPDPKGYYRLKMVDRDATFAYSRIISITQKGTGIVIFSNPTRDQVQIKGLRGGENVFVYNKEGKLVVTQKNIQVGQKVNLADCLPGVYVLEIITNGVQTFRGKVIRNN